MNTVLIVHTQEKKRPQQLYWQPTPGVQPCLGMELYLPQFKHPFFKITRIVSMQNAGFVAQPGWGMSASPYGGYGGGAYGGNVPLQSPQHSESPDEEDLTPQFMGVAQFTSWVIVKPCEPFEVPGFPGLGTTAAQ